jgi:hypothetical protein
MDNRGQGEEGIVGKGERQRPTEYWAAGYQEIGKEINCFSNDLRINVMICNEP